MKTCRIILTVMAGLLSACAVFGTPPPPLPDVPIRMARADERPAKSKKAVVDLKIDGDTVLVVKSLPCTVTAPPGADTYSWNLPKGVEADGDDNVLTIKAAPQGECRISVVMNTIDFEQDKDGKIKKIKKKDTGSVVLAYGGIAPVPPPDPPVPPPNPAPIAEKGLRVFIVFDKKAALPQGQQAILQGKEFRDLLNAKCVNDADGKTKAWRIWDKSEDAKEETKLWQDAFARPRTALPWIVISNGTTGTEGPLPATVQEATALVNKFATPSRSKAQQKGE